MTLRLVEMRHSREDLESVRAALADEGITDLWEAAALEDMAATRCLTASDKVESLVDALEDRFGKSEGFRILILPVEATRPAIEEPEPTGAEPEKKLLFGRVSRDELLENVDDGVRLNGTFVAMATLSAIVASLGLITDNIPVIIGAMVIAPLLAPNMGLALATTLADLDLARRVLRSGGVGITLSFGLAALVGLILHPDPQGPQLAARTRVGLTDVVLALASGMAGALTFTTGLAGALIGVMVALTLLPALVAAGLLFGSGQWELGINALLLFAINIIALNLAAAGTFFAQGIRPNKWWDAKKARKGTWRAIGLWAFLFMVLAVAAWYASKRGVV